jgi:hypothetical protein
MAPRFFIGPALWLAPDSGLTANERLVLAVLCQWTSREEGECFPSISTIAASAALSDASVKRAIRGLVGHGTIQVTHRRKANGAPDSSLYLVLGFDPLPKKGEGSNRPHGGVKGTRGVGSVGPTNVFTDNTPFNGTDFIRTAEDGTVWIGNTPYRDRSARG